MHTIIKIIKVKTI